MAKTSAATAAAPIPIGGDTFTVALKATEAAWVKARARQLGMKPGDLIRSLVASARAADPTKGGTVAVVGAKTDAERAADGE